MTCPTAFLWSIDLTSASNIVHSFAIIFQVKKKYIKKNVDAFIYLICIIWSASAYKEVEESVCYV